MAKSVNAAFDEFLREKVNIPSTVSSRARRSRDFLIDQINKLSMEDKFFKLDVCHNCNFGSFARKTKICVLDDIDLIICLNGDELQESGNQWDDIKLYLVNPRYNKFYKYSDSLYTFGGEIATLNSNKVKNRLLNGLNNVPQYINAKPHSRGEAVTLKLQSYPWNFDIVPAFYCSGDIFNDPYYLIPNGYGNWKKTNPILEQNRITSVNKKFDGKVLDTVRLVKYWNRHGKMPNITSYVLETMVVDYFNKNNYCPTSNYIDLHFIKLLEYISNNIYNEVHDGKNIEGNINNLSLDQKNSIFIRSQRDYERAYQAFNKEIEAHDYAKSINIWRSIFGDEFPTYG